MSTPSTTILATTAVARLGEFLAAHERAGARAWAQIIQAAEDAPTHPTAIVPTARAWMQAHPDDEIRTLQATVHTDGSIVGLWAPGPRRITQMRQSYVRLNDSRQDFAGLAVRHATEDTLITTAARTDGAYGVIVYTVSTVSTH